MRTLRCPIVLSLLLVIPFLANAQEPAIEDGLAVVLDPSTLSRTGSLAPGELIDLYVVLTDVADDGMSAIQFGLDLDPRLIVFDRQFPNDATLNFDVGPDEYIVGFSGCTDFRFVPKIVMSMKATWAGTGTLDDLRIGLRDLEAYGDEIRLTRCGGDQEIARAIDLGGVLLNPTNESVAFFGGRDVVVQGRDLDVGWATSVPAGLLRDGGQFVAAQSRRTFTASPGGTFELRVDGTGDLLATYAPDVIQEPRVVLATASVVPGSIPPRVRVAWEIEGANTIRVAGLGGQPAIGGLVIDVPTAAILLEATNEFGTTTESITVSTGDGLPVALAFTATPLRFAPGQEVVLAWTAFGADTAVIAPGVGAVDPVSGTVSVFPTEETTYALTLTNENGTTVAEVTVAPSLPTILSFTVTPDQVVQGQSVEVQWAVEAADRVLLDPGALEFDQSVGVATIFPDSSDAEVVMTVSNVLGEVVARRAIDVVYPRINSFTATPTLIYPREPVVLAWDVTPGVGIAIDPDIGPIGPTVSNRTVFPDVPGQIYTMTATSGDIVLTAQTEPIEFRLPEVDLSTPVDTVTIGHPFPIRVVCVGCDSLRLDPHPGTVIPFDPDGAALTVNVVVPDGAPLIATAFNAAGSALDTLDIVTRAVEPIVSLTATPTSVFPGTEVVLRAFVDNASSATLEPGIGNVPSGRESLFTVSVDDTTDFVLRAESPAGTVEATQRVVTRPPDAALSAPFFPVYPGEAFALGVATTGADSVTLEPFEGPVPLNGTVTTTLDSTTTFTLTAWNAAGSTTSQRTVSSRLPDVIEFAADLDRAVPGEPVELSWVTRGAADVSILANNVEFGSSLAAVDSLVVSPTETTNYTLVVTNLDGERRRTLAVTVVPIRITAFSASVSFVQPGDILVLSWEVVGDGTVELEGSGLQPLVGQINVAPTQTTTFRIIARNGGEIIETSEVTVRVRSSEPDLVRWSWTPTGIDESPPPTPAFVPFDAWIVAENLTQSFDGFRFGLEVPPHVLLLSRQLVDPSALDLGSGLFDWDVFAPTCQSAASVVPLAQVTLLAFQELDSTTDFLELRGYRPSASSPLEDPSYHDCNDARVPFTLGPPLPLGETDIVAAVALTLRADATDDGVHLTWDAAAGCAEEVHVLWHPERGMARLVATLRDDDACGAWTAPARDGEGRWQVVVVTSSGSLVSDAVEVESVPGGDRLPTRDRLFANVPNPFNPSTALRFALASAGPVTLELFDTAGRRIKRFDLGELPAGEGSVTWHGRDGAGRLVGSGVYLVRLSTRGGVDTRRIVLLK